MIEKQDSFSLLKKHLLMAPYRRILKNCCWRECDLWLERPYNMTFYNEDVMDPFSQDLSIFFGSTSPSGENWFGLVGNRFHSQTHGFQPLHIPAQVTAILA
jgi:hypothetical protein